VTEPEHCFTRDPDERETRLARALMAVSEVMVDAEDIEVVNGLLLAECVRLLDLVAAGLMLTGSRGFAAVGTTGATSTILASLQRSTRAGPSVEAMARNADVDVTIEEARVRWPVWAGAAADLGIGRVVSLPVRRSAAPIGALELLLGRGAAPLGPVAVQVTRTFAGLAAVVVQHADELRRSSTHVQQLETALHSRIVVEQAKGFLVARGFGTPSDAFEALRTYARKHRAAVHVVAESVLSERLDVQALRQ
jgi:hypothetical protein